jgi:hypothetical protein
MTFRTWLVAQQGRQCNVVGDLARDVAGDPNAPDSYRALREYFAATPNHHPNALGCLDEAWCQFKRWRGVEAHQH